MKKMDGWMGGIKKYLTKRINTKKFGYLLLSEFTLLWQLHCNPLFLHKKQNKFEKTQIT